VAEKCGAVARAGVGWSVVIDFRYHVVSLAAVFIALAAGIILGSGPIRTALVDQLTNESDQLRAQLAEARQDVEREQVEGLIGEAFVADASQVLVGQALAEQRVAIVSIAGPEEDDVTAIRARLVEAGADIAADLTVESAWTDREQTTFRASFSVQVADSVIGIDSTVAPERMLAHALAQALAPEVIPASAEGESTDLETGLPGAGSANDRSRVLIDLLTNAEFISGTVTSDVDAIVLVAGQGVGEEADIATQSQTFAQLAGILDEYLGATVVASGSPTAEDVPSAVRSSGSLATRVTTVHDALNFFGTFTVALALEQEISGQSGHYGFGDDQTLFPRR